MLVMSGVKKERRRDNEHGEGWDFRNQGEYLINIVTLWNPKQCSKIPRPLSLCVNISLYVSDKLLNKCVCVAASVWFW